MTESIEIETAPKGRLSIRTIAMPADTNPHGHIFGGWLMSQMDLAGGTHANQRSGGRVVTVAAEAMEFHLPVYVGDEVSCYTEIAKTGRTSIAIQVEVWVRRHGTGLPQIRVTSALYTYVAVDNAGNKRPLPPAR
jgi:acyl-CoA thioesterase YciA